MNKFNLKSRLVLDQFDGWKDCYMIFLEPSIRDVQNLDKVLNKSDNNVDNVIKFIEDAFIEGKGFDGEKIVDLTKKDIAELPLSILMEIQSFLLKKSTSAQSQLKPTVVQ